MRSMVEGAATASLPVAYHQCSSETPKTETAAAPSTTLRVVPLPRFAVEDGAP